MKTATRMMLADVELERGRIDPIEAARRRLAGAEARGTEGPGDRYGAAMLGVLRAARDLANAGELPLSPLGDALLAALVEVNVTGSELTAGVCRECGCTETSACGDEGSACSWTDESETLCTACAGMPA